jgi:hypothetical protein
VKGAQDDVICDPNEQEPPCPVTAAEHEHSAKNREKADDAKPDDARLKRTLSLELGEMVCKSDSAGDYE